MLSLQTLVCIFHIEHIQTSHISSDRWLQVDIVPDSTELETYGHGELNLN